MEPTCKRCGLCCYLHIGKEFRKCKHLIYLRDGTTLCKVYHRREEMAKHGHFLMIGEGNACVLRKLSKYDYEGCPFNTGKPILKIEVK
jgi:hypothetical protein